MKNTHMPCRLAKPAPLLMLIAALTACGGGGGSSPFGASTLPAGIFTKTTDVTPWGNNAYPFAGNNSSQQLQQMYHASEIGAAGYINKIGFRRHFAQANEVTCTDTTIKLGHTDLTGLTTNANDNVQTGEGAHVTVLDNGVITIPAGDAGEYFDIALETPFYYNGKDNLVVEFVRNAACSATVNVSTVVETERSFHAQPIDAGGAGLVFDTHRLARFGFKGGDAKLEHEGGTGIGSFPFSTSASGRHVQLLYLASEIDGSGAIAGIALVNNAALASSRTYTVDIALGHTTLSELGDTFASNVDVGGLVTVASGLEFVVPEGAPAGSLLWLPMTGTFNYNGTDNLIIDMKVTSDVATSLTQRGVSAPARRLAAPLDSATGTVGDITYDIGLRFHGGKVGVLRTVGTDMVLGTGVDAFPFKSTNGLRQYLYRSVELGGAGTITTLACRIGDTDADALVGGNYSIVMSHTAATTLQGDDLPANLPDAKTVYTGPLNLPAKLQGDWHEIQLTAPFAYNGKDNLVVQIAGTSGAVTAGCLGDTRLGSQTLNANRRAYAPSSEAVAGATSNQLVDMLFDIRR